MARIQSICTSDWGTYIEQAARTMAAYCVLIYTAGFVFGQWLHNTNDRLARAYVTLLGLPPSLTSRTPTKAQTSRSAVIQTDAPVSYEACLTADVDLSAHTVKALRKMAQLAGIPRSTYRTARKAELVDLLS